jgi:hypothetical protein
LRQARECDEEGKKKMVLRMRQLAAAAVAVLKMNTVTCASDEA